MTDPDRRREAGDSPRFDAALQKATEAVEQNRRAAAQERRAAVQEQQARRQARIEAQSALLRRARPASGEVERLTADLRALGFEGRSWVTAFGFPPALWAGLVRCIGEIAARRPVKVYAAGCNLGTEVYTLCMTLGEAGLGDRVRIVATDASEVCLRVARRAMYDRSQVSVDVAMSRLSATAFAHHFEEVDERYVAVAPELRAMVDFAAPGWVPDTLEQADVVGLRNVWQHLPPAGRIELVRRLAEVMPADGLVYFRYAPFAEVERFMRRLAPGVYAAPEPDAWRRVDPASLHPGTDWMHILPAGTTVLNPQGEPVAGIAPPRARQPKAPKWPCQL